MAKKKVITEINPVKKPLVKSVELAIGPKLGKSVQKHRVELLAKPEVKDAIEKITKAAAAKKASSAPPASATIKTGKKFLVAKGPDPDEEPSLPKAVPVESEKPGVARHPKPVKVHVPLKFREDATKDVRLAVLEKHLAGLLERLSRDYGGAHTEALESLKADIKQSEPT